MVSRRPISSNAGFAKCRQRANRRVFFFKMKKFIVFVFLMFSLQVKAADVSFAPAYLDFHYKEKSESGRTLNSEHGPLTGIELKGSVEIAGWHFDPSLAYYRGQVDYRGSTQLGLPLQTRTDQELGRLGVNMLRPWLANTAWLVYANYCYWQRSILPVRNVSGLSQDYRWWELGLGFKQQIQVGKQTTLGYDLGLFYIPRAEVVVDLPQWSARDVTLEQGEGKGMQLGLHWQKPLSQNIAASASVVHRRWNIAASDPVRVSTSRGVSLIYEPESESEHTSLNVGLIFSW